MDIKEFRQNLLFADKRQDIIRRNLLEDPDFVVEAIIILAQELHKTNLSVACLNARLEKLQKVVNESPNES